MRTEAIIVAALAVVAGATPFLVDQWSTETDTRTENMSVTVINSSNVENNTDLRLGLNTEANFEYGELPQGVAVRKSLVINGSEPVMVQLDVSGNISKWTDYEKNYYFNGTREIPVEVNSTETGYFAGELEITTTTPANGVGETWLDLKSSLYS